MLRTHSLCALSVGALLFLLPLAAHSIPHGDEHASTGTGTDMHGHGDMGGHTAPSPSTSAAGGGDDDAGPMSYFAYGKHSGTILAHIVLMVLAWFFILPVGTYFPIGKEMG